MHNSFLFAFTMKKSSIFYLHRHVNSHTVADSISAIVLMSRLCFPNLNIWRNSYTNLSVGTNSDGCQALVGCDTKERVRAPPPPRYYKSMDKSRGKVTDSARLQNKTGQNPQNSFDERTPPLSCFYRWQITLKYPTSLSNFSTVPFHVGAPTRKWCVVCVGNG